MINKILLFLAMSTMLFGAPKFLMPDEAFKPYASLNEQMQIVAGVTIADDIYLYEDKLTFEITSSNGISIKNIEGPKATDHHGDMAFTESPSFLIDLKKESGVSGIQEVSFTLFYQGCSEQGLCYEPSGKDYTLSVDTSLLGVSLEKAELKTLNISSVESKSVAQDKPVVEEKSEMDSIADTISSGNIFIILATFLGFGLLLAMTPCVFPMIPIISGLIISQGEGLTTRKAFMLSLVYVLAMSVAYTIAGVLAGLFGANLQAALQTPWVIYSFSFVFVALAFSMFGFYELKLPDSFVNRVSKSGNSSGYVGVAIMGFLSALIVGPCVAAPLAGALVYIGQTGDAVLGGMALFAMSIGMGIPLIVVGVSAGKFMPKPGAWMTMVTAVFGVMMLGVAVWMLERVVDASVTMALYGMLFLGFSIFLGTLDKEVHVFKKSVALIMFIYSVALLVGVLAGSTSMTQPLSFLKSNVVVSSSNTVQVQDKEFIKITSIEELDTLLEKNKGKKIILDFYADWCTACKELEEVTFSNADVKNKMDEFVLIQADVTANTNIEQALSDKFGVFGPPTIIFFDENSKVMSAKTLIGFIEPEPFLKHLNTL